MRRKIKRWFLTIVGIFLIAIAWFTWPYYRFMRQTLHISVLKTILSLDSLKTFDHQVNILILGIAGGNRPGDSPNLSDSIIVANYNFKTNRLTTISVPRDIWSETLKDKINSAYAYGGFILARTEIQTIVGLPIQYAVVIDFKEFRELIDFLGGVDINVEKTFDDYAYPIEDKETDPCGHAETDIKTFIVTAPSEMQIWEYFPCRYEHIHFDRGFKHMDGKTALKFVRSRHAEGEEGSDFARGTRQQKVLEAVKNKLITQTKKGNIASFEKLYAIIDKLVKRDLTNQQVAIMAKNILLKRGFVQKQATLSEDFFIVPYSSYYNDQWVLLPKSGDFSTVYQYVACVLANLKNCEDLKKK